MTNSFLHPPVSLPPTLGSHDSGFSFAVSSSEAPWRQAVRVPDRGSLENWRAGAGRWQEMSAFPPLPLLHHQGSVSQCLLPVPKTNSTRYFLPALGEGNDVGTVTARKGVVPPWTVGVVDRWVGTGRGEAKVFRGASCCLLSPWQVVQPGKPGLPTFPRGLLPYQQPQR